MVFCQDPHRRYKPIVHPLLAQLDFYVYHNTSLTVRPSLSQNHYRPLRSNVLYHPCIPVGFLSPPRSRSRVAFLGLPLQTALITLIESTSQSSPAGAEKSTGLHYYCTQRYKAETLSDLRGVK